MGVNTDSVASPGGFGRQGSSSIYSQGTSPNTRVAVSQKIRLFTPSYASTQNRDGAKILSQIGVVSSWNGSENRQVDEVRGIGYGDTIAELVPSATQAMQVQVERAMLYLSNLWQATGYAAGVDGPVRSLRQHKWPFDCMKQTVFSTLADWDRADTNVGKGLSGTVGAWDGGVSIARYPQSTKGGGWDLDANEAGLSAILDYYETCWWNSWSQNISKDQGQIMESGTAIVRDVHDFSSTYGEFLATGNDPTLGQFGSLGITRGR